MPDPDRLLRTLYKAAEAVRQTPGRKGRFVQVHDATEVLVAGDMHGHVGNFQAVYQAAQLASHPTRHLVVQELIHGEFLYPSGADKSHQLIDLFAALKCQFPRQVHFLMGNHELAQWTNRLVMKNDRDLNAVFRQGVTDAYGAEKGSVIYDAYLRLFGVLPLVLRTKNRVVLSHSLPREKCRDTFDLRMLETEAFAPEDLTVNGLAYELLWGRDTRAENCDAFLQKMDCDYLVTGHIRCETGFGTPNPRQIIVDCCDSPASYVLLPADRPITPDEFRASVHLL